MDTVEDILQLRVELIFIISRLKQLVSDAYVQTRLSILRCINFFYLSSTKITERTYKGPLSIYLLLIRLTNKHGTNINVLTFLRLLAGQLCKVGIIADRAILLFETIP